MIDAEWGGGGGGGSGGQLHLHPPTENKRGSLKGKITYATLLASFTYTRH